MGVKKWGMVVMAALLIGALPASARAVDVNPAAEWEGGRLAVDVCLEDPSAGLRLGPYELSRGDIWTARLAWEGGLDARVFAANQPVELGGEWHTGQIRTGVGNVLPALPVTIPEDGTYWFFVGDSGAPPAGRAEGTLTLDRVGMTWAGGEGETAIPVDVGRLAAGEACALGPYALRRGDRAEAALLCGGGAPDFLLRPADGGGDLRAESADRADDASAAQSGDGITVKKDGEYQIVLQGADGAACSDITGEIRLIHK